MTPTAEGREPRQLSRRARRLWLLAHVVLSVGWLGAGAANLALASSALGAQGGPLPSATTYQAIHRIDAYVVIPAAFGALTTGVVLSLGTKWGLFKHWWVFIKLVLTVTTIIFSTLGLGLWVEESLATPAASTPPHALSITLGATGNILAFLVMTALSIYTPKAPMTRHRHTR